MWLATTLAATTPTGSGKTLTSFKAARLATELDFIDKVFFVVDRKDLDYQTMKEYQRFSPDSVNGSDSTAGLKRNLDKDDNRIVVTTIQKLNNLMKNEDDLAIYGKQVVFIFDECHRSQFGEAQRKPTRRPLRSCLACTCAWRTCCRTTTSLRA